VLIRRLFSTVVAPLVPGMLTEPADRLMTARYELTATVVFAAAVVVLSSCALISTTLRTNGEQQLAKVPPSPKQSGPRLIIFAMDGATPEQLSEAIRLGQAPRIAALLGHDQGNGLLNMRMPRRTL